MLKTVGVKMLRYGVVYCLFGVFGVLVIMVPWFKHSFVGDHDDS